jgi:hypothetical protein
MIPIKFEKGTVYHCKTEDIAKVLLTEAHEQGYKWCNDASYITTTEWDTCKIDTCYNIIDGSFCAILYAEEQGYTIINANDILLYELSSTHRLWLKAIIKLSDQHGNKTLGEFIIHKIITILNNGHYNFNEKEMLNKVRKDWYK